MSSDFNELEEELKKMEDDFQLDQGDDILRHLVSPSASDYWKKRFDEEKTLWTKIAEEKEKEKRETEEKLSGARSEMKTLTQRIKDLELTLQKEVLSWQDKLKTRETELQLDRERSEFESRIRGLEQENSSLKGELSKTIEQEKNLRKQQEEQHGREMRELLDSQNAIIENIEALEKEIAYFETLGKEQLGEIEEHKTRIKKLVEESFALEREITALNKKMEQKTAEMLARDAESEEYFSSVIEFFAGKIKTSLGTVLGALNFCFRKLKVGFLSENTAVKKQLVVLENVVNEIFASLERMILESKREKMNLQEMPVERLFSRLNPEIDTAGLPDGFKVRADTVKLARFLKKYCENASNVTQKYIAASNEIEFRIAGLETAPAAAADFIQLRHVVYMHGWKMVLNAVEKKYVMTINIRGY